MKPMKGTVTISIDDYNSLIEANQKLKHDKDDLISTNDMLVNQLADEQDSKKESIEELKNKIEVLAEHYIRKLCQYNGFYGPYEKETDINNETWFPVKRTDLNHLLECGISSDFIVKVVKEERGEYDKTNA